MNLFWDVKNIRAILIARPTGLEKCNRRDKSIECLVITINSSARL